jgi:hypothetical protein
MRAQLIRDKETLAEEGVEVHAEAQLDGTWVYWIDPDEFYLPELDLTDQEEVALAAAAAAMEPGNGRFSPRWACSTPCSAPRSGERRSCSPRGVRTGRARVAGGARPDG